jgi:putative flippase GtrA
MVANAITYAWSLRREFAKYFIVGISAVVFDMGTLIAAKELLHIPPTFAVVVNQAFVLVYVFLVNKYWSFRNREVPHKQAVRFLSLAAFNYAVSVFTMYVFHDTIGFDYRLVRLGTIALMVSWNFFLYKYWVYKPLLTENTPSGTL